MLGEVVDQCWKRPVRLRHRIRRNRRGRRSQAAAHDPMRWFFTSKTVGFLGRRFMEIKATTRMAASCGRLHLVGLVIPLVELRFAQDLEVLCRSQLYAKLDKIRDRIQWRSLGMHRGHSPSRTAALARTHLLFDKIHLLQELT